MNEFTFQQPQAAWLMLAVPLLWAAKKFLPRPFAFVATHRMLAGTVGASRSRRLPTAVICLAFGAVVLALMDPVLPFAEERVVSRGLDIALVLDLSSSMEEQMGGEGSPSERQTRLDVTKRAIRDFIARRPEDRIGLVVFSDNAYVVSPLTLDHQYLQRYVASIDEYTLRSEGMTAIGEGVAVADTLLRRQAAADERRNSVLVVFTDGEHNHGRDPVEAVADADQAGHRIYLIGVDLDDEVKHKPAVRNLVRAVEEKGGRYFTADTRGQLSAASAAIDRLETGMLISTRAEQNAPAYASFAAAGIVALCAALLLGAIPWFVDLT